MSTEIGGISNMLDLGNLKTPNYMKALEMTNEITNVREVEIEFPLLKKKVSVTPLIGIDDVHLKTLFSTGAHFLKSLNKVLFQHIKQDEIIFKDVEEMNSKLTEYDKRILVFGLLAASYDKLDERTLKCPECGHKDIHEFEPELMFKEDTIRKTWDKRESYLDYTITKNLMDPSEKTSNGINIDITYKIPTEADKIKLMELIDLSPRKIDENSGNIMTTIEYLILYIKSITFTNTNLEDTNPEKVIVIDDLESDILPFVTQSNMIIQNRLVKTSPFKELEEYQPRFYFNCTCRNESCGFKYKYNIGNIEDEFFRKALSIYR